MHLHSETPRLTGSIVRNGASVVIEAGQLQNYQITASPATEIAAFILAAKHRLPLHIAKLVCELARIGGPR
ncbi:hypothetical protein [Mesorhizobium sp. 131-2-1]|uniref:hypothetical protein n=1 Tax=Mesorhizobium sp. 131-2-1 TaxID=2744518 RepID=UPI00192916FB|nr:hypothetical protein [Mesorhizobium sp. 131-2-1]BCG91415.1 hypothetical protein MesoLj131a_02790 [Mesorhizobium sp. 131-2-1]